MTIHVRKHKGKIVDYEGADHVNEPIPISNSITPCGEFDNKIGHYVCLPRRSFADMAMFCEQDHQLTYKSHRHATICIYCANSINAKKHGNKSHDCSKGKPAQTKHEAIFRLHRTCLMKWMFVQGKSQFMCSLSNHSLECNTGEELQSSSSSNNLPTRTTC